MVQLDVIMNQHLNLIQDHIYFIDKYWKIITLNEAAINYLGKTRKELEGELVWDVFPPDMDYHFFLKRAMESKVTEHWEDYNKSIGEWFRSSAFGYENGVFLCCTNISKERQALRALKDSETKLQAVFNSMNDGYLLLDSSYKVLSFNAKSTLILNNESNLNVGDDIRKHLLKYLLDDFEINFKQALLDIQKQSVFKVYGDEGIHKWMRLSFIKVHDSIKINSGWISIVLTDIDDIMQSKEALKKNFERLEKIRWVQSHRFRASISRILGLIDLTKMDDCSISEKEDYLKIIEENILQMDEVLKEMAKD